ncbi:2Fe-2S iron-sulfur cluster-binding protein [Halopenitus sp. POP-27]|uniref:2Fe-2S iron-sulfur cluster-binding protein n=1 Tax=Halopenitus sp. POP-27 TaxID=2994425 RepID=UPI0024686B69|nr:2Fe-2S iron-sulfur cluster-binding protein [Halopenitus sp. POP-27]
MVDPLAIGVATAIVLVVVFFSSLEGTGWSPAEDISEEVLERRAATVPETDFPEPMNRAIGGGGGAVAVGGGAEGETGELEEGGAEESAGPGDIPEDEVEYYEVEFVKEGETVEIANDEPILDQGEDQGWDMPYACRQGQCVSCAAHITDGPSEDFVVHDDQQMLGEAEIEDGYTLTCVAYPRDSFSIETGEAP